MLKFLTTIAAALGLMVVGSAINRADAMPLGDPSGMRAATGHLNIVDNVQFFWGDREYCWYDDGWRGPGWYWCGNYYLTPGFGWGGGYGWHGWRGGHVGRIGRVGRVGRVGRTGGKVGRVGRTGGKVGRVGRTGGKVGRVGRVGRVGGGRVGGGRTGGGRTGGKRSDIMLKHDIALLGHLDNGLGFYRFSYNGSDKAYVGVMAQEVQTVMPNAVVRGSDGYLRVFYDKIGVKFEPYEQWVSEGAHVPAGAPIRQ